MTALDKYQRLESGGLWRAAPDAQRRDVVVSFGDATLVLADPRTDIPLSHWSIPAIIRMNPGETPALYSPDDGESETLEIEDPDMIAALETVHDVLESRRPHPGRLRRAIVASVLAAAVALAIFWLPGALARHAASVLPVTTRVAIGHEALSELARLTGSPCSSPLGARAEAELARRLQGAGVRQIVVVRTGVPAALALPGGIVVLNRTLVEKAADGGTAAGFALAAATQAKLADPMVRLLNFAGPLATARLLATGSLPRGSIHGYAERLVNEVPPPLPAATLIPAFRAMKLSVRAYANARKDTALAAEDPFKGVSPEPALADRYWVSLQSICSG